MNSSASVVGSTLVGVAGRHKELSAAEVCGRYQCAPRGKRFLGDAQHISLIAGEILDR